MIGMSQLPYSLAALRACTSNSALAVAHMTAAAPLRFCSQEGARKLHAGRVANGGQWWPWCLAIWSLLYIYNNNNNNNYYYYYIYRLLSYWIWYSGQFMNIQASEWIQNIQWKIWSTHYGSSEIFRNLQNPWNLCQAYLPLMLRSTPPKKSAPYCDPRVLWRIAFGISRTCWRDGRLQETRSRPPSKKPPKQKSLAWMEAIGLRILRILGSWLVRKSYKH